MFYYYPKKFYRKYVQIKGNASQLGIFMACVLGIKPFMDDWIPKDKLIEFKKMCKDYGLKTREDVIFINIPKDKLPDNILGKQFLTTTHGYGLPLKTNAQGEVHLFISKDEKTLNKGMWYPVIVRDRVIFHLRADGLKYGYTLGYPECCIKFFRKFNDYLRYSHLYEAYINTESKFSFLCNPFLKDTSFSYIYHMPCSYDCKETIKLAGRLRKEIQKREPDYVKLADQYLKMPFLVFYERKIYCFDGILKENTIRYNKVYFVPPDSSNNLYLNDFKQADSLRLEGRRILLFKKDKLIKIINVELKNFAPEYPFLIQFS